MAVDIVIPEMGESVRTGVVARWVSKDGDAVKRVLDVGRINAHRIERQHHARSHPQPQRHQRQRAQNLAHPRQQNGLARQRHPRGHDRQESLGRRQMH
ncbi:MAG: hypothetical protein K2Q09_09400, partial [Phycisphaerales bacterium]|nr:hypothetical protein [Phycisphaerales bacterium]